MSIIIDVYLYIERDTNGDILYIIYLLQRDRETQKHTYIYI